MKGKTMNKDIDEVLRDIPVDQIPPDLPSEKISDFVDQAIRKWEQRIRRQMKIIGLREMTSGCPARKARAEALIKAIEARPVEEEPTPFFDEEMAKRSENVKKPRKKGMKL